MQERLRRLLRARASFYMGEIMKKMKRFWIAAAALSAFAALFFGCGSTKGAAGAGKASPVKREAGKTYELVVLHTNDQHGQGLAKSDGKGGLASQATFVKQVRAANKNVLLLSAGDINIGTALSNMFNAEPDIVAYNEMGYDAVTFGNHEFDGTAEKLQQQMKISKFPWLSANIRKGDGYLGKPYIIKDYEGIRVAVIGLTTNRTLVISSPDKSLTFTDEIDAASDMVKQVREQEKADVVIVCGHLGDIEETDEQETSVKLARAVEGIDLIIDGHSHSYFAEPKVVNGVPIVTANEHGKVVGEGHLEVRDGALVGFSWKPVGIDTTAFPPDPDMVKTLQPYVGKAEAALKEVVLTTTAPFEFGAKLPRYQEMPSGDVLADGIAWYVRGIGVDVDFAFSNGGNIRTALPAGEVTREQILTMLPFENYIYVVTLKGSEVVELFDFIGSIRQGAGGWAQVSKDARYTITYDANGDGTVSGVTVAGEPIDPEKTYRIATNDYLAGGGDGYAVLQKSSDTFNTAKLLTDVFIDYVKTLGTYTPATDGRITVVGGTLPE